MRVLAFPFDIAANRIGCRQSYRLTRDRFLQSAVKIVDRHLGRIARIVNSSAGVDKLAIVVEYVEMWSSQCPDLQVMLKSDIHQ